MTKQSKKPPAATIKSIADALGVTPRRVSQLRQAGMPCDTIAAAESWRSRKSAAGEISVDALRKARFHLIESQQRKIDLENRLRAGELMPVSECYEGGLIIGSGMKAALLRLMNDLPPRLEGCTAIEIFRVLKDAFYAMLRDASESNFFFDTPEVRRLLEEFRAAHQKPMIHPNKRQKP
jgi:hypothetical protein